VLTTTNTSLVSGARPSAPAAKSVHVKVLRPFLIGGVAQPLDTVLEVDVHLAAELITANKAVRVPAPQPAPAPAPAKSACKKE
jgi:hypothetical protein